TESAPPRLRRRRGRQRGPHGGESCPGPLGLAPRAGGRARRHRQRRRLSGLRRRPLRHRPDPAPQRRRGHAVLTGMLADASAAIAGSRVFLHCLRSWVAAPRPDPTNRAHRRPVTTTTFAALGVAPDLVAALAEQGIDEPFPIQALTIRDVLA